MREGDKNAKVAASGSFNGRNCGFASLRFWNYDIGSHDGPVCRNIYPPSRHFLYVSKPRIVLTKNGLRRVAPAEVILSVIFVPCILPRLGSSPFLSHAQLDHGGNVLGAFPAVILHPLHQNRRQTMAVKGHDVLVLLLLYAKAGQDR